MILIIALLALIMIWGVWAMMPRPQQRPVRIRVDDRQRRRDRDHLG